MTRWDFVVVGGGPAGMSAALIASQNQLTTLLLESGERLGGQVRWADAAIPDLLGAEATTGDELADRFVAHLSRAQVEVRTSAAVSRIRCGYAQGCEEGVGEKPLHLTLASGEEMAASRVLLASGMRHRQLDVPGIELADRRAAPRKALDEFRGCRVVVVGGGDEASSLARDLAEHGAAVDLLVRGDLRARPRYAEAIHAFDAVTIRKPAVVARLEAASGEGERVVVTLTSGDEIVVDECFQKIGVEPSLPKIEPPLVQLPDGRLRVDEQLRTSNAGLFAAGDLIRPPAERYIAAALADGAVVGRRVETDLDQAHRETPSSSPATRRTK